MIHGVHTYDLLNDMLAGLTGFELMGMDYTHAGVRASVKYRGVDYIIKIEPKMYPDGCKDE